MDLHPLFVHFPIALLTVYSILEVGKRFTKASYWVQVRAVLVVIGTVGAFVSLQTGEQAQHLFQNNALHDVLEKHSLSADITTWLYAVLAVAYIVTLSVEHPWYKKIQGKMQNPMGILFNICTKILTTPIAPIVAAIGFIALSLTGALGAILVYGPEFDPITSIVYKLLF